MRKQRMCSLAAVIFLLWILSGCNSPEQVRAEAGYQSPPLATAAYHDELAAGDNGVRIDTSAVAQGYVAVAATSSKRLKMQVIFQDSTYTYDLSQSGEPAVYPLQSGSGLYEFRVMQNTTENKYIELYSIQAKVQLASEFEPFLRPSQMVNYDGESECVALAGELAGQAADEAGVVAAVYEYIKTHITYDYDKAASDLTGYVPAPDSTLAQGKGICFDYAALAAAMLRSQGVPTKVVTGYVSGGAVYHAWNMIYLTQSGWITVEIRAPKNEWQPIDLTFAANGADEALIGDGSDYIQRYVY